MAARTGRDRAARPRRRAPCRSLPPPADRSCPARGIHPGNRQRPPPQGAVVSAPHRRDCRAPQRPVAMGEGNRAEPRIVMARIAGPFGASPRSAGRKAKGPRSCVAKWSGSVGSAASGPATSPAAITPCPAAPGLRKAAFRAAWRGRFGRAVRLRTIPDAPLPAVRAGGSVVADDRASPPGPQPGRGRPARRRSGRVPQACRRPAPGWAAPAGVPG